VLKFKKENSIKNETEAEDGNTTAGVCLDSISERGSKKKLPFSGSWSVVDHGEAKERVKIGGWWDLEKRYPSALARLEGGKHDRVPRRDLLMGNKLCRGGVEKRRRDYCRKGRP